MFKKTRACFKGRIACFKRRGPVSKDADEFQKTRGVFKEMWDVF